METGTFAMSCLCFSILCMILAFASPYWLESFSEADSPFVKLGLWEFCFNDYTFYKDYNGKRYLGCWWIFSSEARPLWEWISPPWFIACQVMTSITLLVQCVTCLVATFAYWRCLPGNMKELIYLSAAGALALCVVLILIVLIFFGVRKEDRGWVPRPDQNLLSWSYGMCCVSGFFSLFAGLIFVKAARDDVVKDY